MIFPLFLVYCIIILTLYALYFVLLRPFSGISSELVFWSAWITMATTGLGVVPFLFLSTLNKSWIAAMNAVAAGMMLSASVGLIEEGLLDNKDDKFGPEHSSLFRVGIGLVLGIAFIYLSKLKLDEQEDSFSLMELNGMDAKRACLIMTVMTLHSLSEGVGIGVSYNSHSLGTFISLTMVSVVFFGMRQSNIDKKGSS
jgi:ZIP family zinc transporter